MARDLQLPDEAAIEIATTMLEQLYGLDDVAGVSSSGMDVGGSSTSTSSTTLSVETDMMMRGAWKMDPKEYMATTTHIISIHRPI
jgi:hypothetical protein